MKIIVYVEGPSDKLAMETLLSDLIAQKREQGIDITFHEAPSGDRKNRLLNAVPIKAANILRNDPDAIVLALPDLYPKNHGFKHESCQELRLGIQAIFEKEVMNREYDVRIIPRFQAFCFKHDMEALLLAVPDLLAHRIGVKPLKVDWKTPVEEQNNIRPPKYVVQELFKTNGKTYKDTVDAPMILGKANCETLKLACPEGFGTFVQFLEAQHG